MRPIPPSDLTRNLGLLHCPEMTEFRHYLLTRFNTGLYGPNPRLRIVHRELPGKPEFLRHFGIDPSDLPTG